MRALALALLLCPAWACATTASAQRGARMPACDPYGRPAGGCGRVPDGCGGFYDLGSCAAQSAPRTVVRDVGVWAIGGPAEPTPAFATSVGPPAASASWIYAFSNRPLAQLRVQARYPGGRAAWAFPSATRALRWTGVGSPPPDAGPWSEIASAVATEAFGRWSHNGVLLHAGAVRVRSPVTVRDAGVVSARGEHTVFIVTADAFEEHRVFGSQPALIRTGDHDALRARLTEELTQRGLREVEARALIAHRVTPRLRAAPQPALYFLPREAIDRAQPLTIRPAPDVLQRVRLIADYR